MASKLTIIFCSGYEYFESLVKILFIYVCPSNQLVTVLCGYEFWGVHFSYINDVYNSGPSEVYSLVFLEKSVSSCAHLLFIWIMLYSL